MLLWAAQAPAQETAQPSTATPTATPTADASSVEARLAALEQKAAEAPRPALPEVKLGGVVQVDGRLYDDTAAQPITDTILLRRVRLDATAKVTSAVSGRIQIDVAGGVLQTLDAYADARLHPALALRAGKFTPSVGYERLVATPALLFIEYAQTSNLVPNRDIGVQASGDPLPWLGYAIGVFDGVADAGTTEGDTSDDKDLVARLALRPFEGLTIHLAGSHGSRAGTAANPLLPSYKSDAQGVTWFKYNATVAAVGEHSRATAAASYYVGGLGLLAEYVASRQRVVNTPAAPGVQTEARPTNTAWQAAASYVVTGERNGEGVVKPATTVEQGGLGAVRVRARYQQATVDDVLFAGNVFANAGTSASKATVYGGGVDWWPVAPLRVLLEYSQTDFTGGAAAGADKPSDKAWLGRVQVAF